ncbi:MAG: hypothetical protein ACPLVJ_00620 [Candidatus Bathyarchaeales archaeon]
MQKSKGKYKEMYQKVENFLKRHGYSILDRKRITVNREELGQKFIEPDVVGCKDNEVWIFECKQPCTIEQFGFALGQLACYKWIFDQKTELLEKRIGKEVKNVKYSIALLATSKYPLKNGLLKTFKEILNHYRFEFFGLLKIEERNGEYSEPEELLKSFSYRI